jgi:hypothetical protein
MSPQSNQPAPNVIQPAQPTHPRRPYSSPRLITHGTVANITAELQQGVGYALYP